MCGTQWRSWLRHCTTSRKVEGSVPNGVIGIFHWYSPSSLTVALGSTQPLTEMSTRNIYWGVKGVRCVGLTTLPPSCADCLEIWEPQPPENLTACLGLSQGLLYVCITHLCVFLCVRTSHTIGPKESDSWNSELLLAWYEPYPLPSFSTPSFLISFFLSFCNCERPKLTQTCLCDCHIHSSQFLNHLPELLSFTL